MYARGYFDMTQCLIVEGTGESARYLKSLLSVYGFDLEGAANANEALEKCHAGMPDVILLPEQLPDMEASAFIKRLRRAGKGAEPAVFLCADKADSERIGKAIWEGASDYLIEPFDAEVLDAKLKQAGVV